MMDIALLMSFMILLVIPVVALLVTVWLWRHGKAGRFFLVGIVAFSAMELHSIVYPQKLLKENYAAMMYA